ncbi:MAG TPA: pitrilysin family protein [Gammaproteobacteria bacterium]|nr:pitrilysin family protein [Gammaproteobacteria bacterium]
MNARQSLDAARAARRRPHALFAPLLAAAALFAAHAPTAARAAPDTEVVRATLDNGLRVIVVRNTLAPVAAISMNYLVGSNESPEGFPGMAHVEEHMMFRGSPGLSADQLAAIGNVMGGDFNANTRETLTQYLFTVPAEDLDVALHIEALRMRAISATAAAWEQERGAMEQEVAQDLSQPAYVLYSKLRAALFAGTPYEHDALGSRPSFQKTTAEMIASFHDSWYAPNNAILVVAGDVEPDATIASVKNLFGGIEASKLPERPRFELAGVEPATFQVDTSRATGTQMIAFRLPGLESPDFPALEVLADVLNSERFDLVGLAAEGKVVGASFAFDPMPTASMAYAAAAFTAEQDPKAVDGLVRAILEDVAKNGVPAELVEAAKMQERSQAEFQKNSIDGLAAVWSEAVAVYGLTTPDQDLERIERVTPEDVKRVAAKYLDLSHAVTATMVPHGSGAPTPSTANVGGEEKIELGKPEDTELPEWAASALARLPAPKLTTDPKVSTLSNGLTLIVQPEDVSDTISVYGRIENRPELEEPAGKEGVASVLEQLFPFGTERLDRLAFQQALDAIGAGERAGSDFAVKVLAKDFERGVELLAENELRPALPANAFTIMRDQLARIVARRNDTPGHLSGRALREALFPESDPSLREPTEATVKGLTHDDVLEYYRYAFRPDLTTIVVIGNVEPDKAAAVIEKYFGAWKAEGPKPPTHLPKAPPNDAAVVAVPDATRVQDSVVLGETLGLSRADKDYYALTLGNAVLGGGFYSSRLSVELRKKAGLVYSVGSDLQAGPNRSVYLVQYASDPENVDRAAGIIRREIEAMQSEPVAEGELRRVKAMLLRQIPLGEASVEAIARAFIGRTMQDLPLDEPLNAARRYIDLSPDDVEAAFKKWLRPGDLVRVSQGPAVGGKP